jgi:hypothetical protein
MRRAWISSRRASIAFEEFCKDAVEKRPQKFCNAPSACLTARFLWPSMVAPFALAYSAIKCQWISPSPPFLSECQPIFGRVGYLGSGRQQRFPNLPIHHTDTMNCHHHSPRYSKILATSIALRFLAVLTARAAVLTWDTNPLLAGPGDGVITGGSGTWTTRQVSASGPPMAAPRTSGG